jgi:hypothetical protein
MKRIALLVLCAVTGIPYCLADNAAAMAVLQAGCTQDAQRLCSGVQPGGGRVIALEPAAGGPCVALSDTGPCSSRSRSRVC